MPSIHDKLDSLLLESCPNAAAQWSMKELLAFADSTLGRFQGLRDFSRVFPTGSFSHQTAIEVNSGVDILVVRDASGSAQVEPSRLIDDLAGALGSNRPRLNRHGFLVDDAELGSCCFIPAVSEPDGTNVRIIDFDELRWRSSCPVAHARALRTFNDLDRCVVRFAKTWNNDQVVPLPSFHIEAIVIAAFLDSELWKESHIHWKIKTFFDVAKEQISDRRGHPLDKEVCLDFLVPDATAQVMRQLKQAGSAANNAWFLMEFEPDIQSAVGAYALFLDPSLGE